MEKEPWWQGAMELSHGQRSRMTSVSGWPSTKKAWTLSLYLCLYRPSLTLPSVFAYVRCMLVNIISKGLTVSSSGRESHKTSRTGGPGPALHGAINCKEPRAQPHCKCYHRNVRNDGDHCKRLVDPVNSDMIMWDIMCGQRYLSIRWQWPGHQLDKYNDQLIP